MKKTKLKPCPFCGGEDVMTMLCGDGYYVVCYSRNKGKGCGSSTGWHETEQEAIESWNRRTNDEMEIKPGK